MLFETQFSLSLLSQLIEQWKQIAANLVILVATNLVMVFSLFLLFYWERPGWPVHPQPDRGGAAARVPGHARLHRRAPWDGGREREVGEAPPLRLASACCRRDEGRHHVTCWGRTNMYCWIYIFFFHLLWWWWQRISIEKRKVRDNVGQWQLL